MMTNRNLYLCHKFAAWTCHQPLRPLGMGCGRVRGLLASAMVRYFVLGALPALMLLFPTKSSAQGIELSGGWVHITHDFGTDGFDVGGAYWFNSAITLAFDYDAAWD